MSIRIHQRSLSFRRPFATSRWTLAFRDVVYIEITDPDSGLRGTGEAAPFEDFGTESLAETLDAVQSLGGALTPLPSGIGELRETLAAIPALRGAPCASFAVESALLDLLSRREGVSMARLLAGDGALLNQMLVNAVIGAADAEQTARDALAAVNNGYTCLKLKIGRAALSDDIDAVEAVRETVGPAVLLRLDANGAWERDQALLALAALEPFDIEYVEQPVRADDINALRDVTAHSPVPIAADEALATIEHARGLLEDGAADVFILKPMALGSLLDARDFALEAQTAWKDVVFTSLLDSAIGRRAVAQLVASLPSCGQRHHGLATGVLFESDIAIDPIEHGCFLFSTDAGLGLSLPESAAS
jgi:o-succinylbenzoate synthase